MQTGESALYVAAREGHLAVVKMLTEAIAKFTKTEVSKLVYNSKHCMEVMNL